MNADISRFVSRLLEDNPSLPNSIELDIDTEGDECGLFEALLLIMTDMLKRWYTPPITIGRITPTDADRLSAYFASFGYYFVLTAEELPRVAAINNRMYLNQTKLEHMKFQVAHEDKLYTVRFSIMPTA